MEDAKQMASLFGKLLPEFNEANVATIGNAAPRARSDRLYRAVMGIANISPLYIRDRADWQLTIP